DILEGLASDDTLIGGDGNDTYVFDVDTNLGTDTIIEDVGSGGTDTLDFSGTTTVGIVVSLSEGNKQNVTPSLLFPNLFLRLITCHSIENVIGGDLDDVIFGNSLDNRLEGHGGNDILIGGSGNDTYVFNTDVALGSDVIFENADIEGGIDKLDFSATNSL